MIILTFLPTYVTAGLALAVMCCGVWVILTDGAREMGTHSDAARRAVLAGIVVAPMAAMAPWTTPGGTHAAAFGLAAAALWVAELAAARPGGPARAWLVPAAAAVATFLSPQAIVLALTFAAFHIVRGRAGDRRTAAGMAALAATAFVVFFLMLEASDWSPRTVADVSASALRRGWAAADWYGARLGKNFLRMHLAYNGWFYWPMALPIAALLLPARKDWWFAPTLFWAVVLLLGTVFIGRETEVFYSLPLQAALLVPSGTAGMLYALGRPCGRDARRI